MELSDIIAPDAVFPNLKASSKKQVLQDLASRGAERTGLSERAIFAALLERERLGSTGVGHGVAIPHGKFTGLPRITGLFARMSKPVAFDAMDDMPVDIICLLLAPEGSGAEHLKALSRIARLLRSEERLARI
ncbi:PTS sugar transporter subunit IIA, partial [Rhizobiaceae bacterium]|nr:PTS sugar transporter subunit IIA [Rhizobiaceae bacterium]